MLYLPKPSITKILAKLTKEKEKEKEGEGGCHLPKNCSTRSTSSSRGVENFPSQGDVCSLATNINLSNLAKGQSTYLCSQEVNELGCFSRIRN